MQLNKVMDKSNNLTWPALLTILFLSVLSGVFISLDSTDSTQGIIKQLFGTLIIVIIFVIVLLVMKPHHILFLLPLTIPFYDVEFNLFFLNISLSDVVMWLTIGTFFIHQVPKSAKTKITVAEKLLLLLVLVRVMSVFMAVEQGRAVIASISFAVGVLFTIASHQIIVVRAWKFFKAFSVIFVLSSLPAMLLGIAQYIYVDPLIDLSNFLGYKYDALIIARRAQSFFANPNTFAAYMVVVIFVYAGIYKQQTAISAKVWIFFGAVASFIGMVITLSRGAYLSLVVGLIAFFWRRGQSVWKQVRLFVFVGLAFFTLYEMYNYVTIENRRRDLIEVLLEGEQITDQSALNRFYFVTTAFNMFRNSPMLLGVGTGQYQVFFEDHRDERILTDKASFASHNIYLSFLAENGLPGILLFVGAIFLIWLQAFRVDMPTRANGQYYEKYWLLMGYRGAWVSYLLYGASHNIMNGPLLYLLTSVMLAMPTLLSDVEQQESLEADS